MKRRAFTLIELLVVIALITLLGTLVIMGIGHLQTNAKRQQTQLILQNLSGMVADYDANRRVPFGAGNLNPNLISGALANNYLAMPAPGDVTTNGADRTGVGGNPSVSLTRDFMTQLMSVPSTATAIGKLPPSSMMMFAGTNPANAPAWQPGPNGTPYHLYDIVSYTDQFNNTVVYIRTLVLTDSSGNPLQDGGQQAPPNYYYWMPALQVPNSGTPLTTPVPLDAWGNPIIFVMGGVLSNVNGRNVTSPGYHPFFASAGPDGNFQRGDDNMYSFEK